MRKEPTQTRTFNYNDQGDLTSSVTPQSDPGERGDKSIVSASYDSNGNMTSGVGATFAFDVGNRVLSAAEISGGVE
jgi:hypothetical protein